MALKVMKFKEFPGPNYKASTGYETGMLCQQTWISLMRI